MLTMTQLCGFMVGDTKPPPSISFVGLTRSAAATNHTLSGVSIGAVDPTRRLIFFVHTLNSVATRTINSFTIDDGLGGGAVSVGSPLFTVTSAAFLGGYIAVFSMLKPTGTTATLQINTSGTNSNLAVETFRALNETVASPHATMTDGSAGGGVLNGTIDIPNNGWVAAASNGFGSGPSPTGMTWSGVTESSDDVFLATVARCSSGFLSGLPSQTARPVSSTIDSSTASQNGALAALSWG